MVRTVDIDLAVDYLQNYLSILEEKRNIEWMTECNFETRNLSNGDVIPGTPYYQNRLRCLSKSTKIKYFIAL